MLLAGFVLLVETFLDLLDLTFSTFEASTIKVLASKLARHTEILGIYGARSKSLMSSHHIQNNPSCSTYFVSSRI